VARLEGYNHCRMTYLRIAGGAAVVVGLFLRNLDWHGSDSAFQIAARWSSVEAIVLFFAALLYGAVAATSTFFTRRVVSWLELTLVILGLIGLAFVVVRYGIHDDGVRLSWAALSLAGGFALTVVGAHGRYRQPGRE
jgi:drug/metabolite transporter (DMT)-like permease